MKRILIFTLCLSWFATGYADDGFNKAGRTSMQFMKIGIGARMAGMGEAGIANMYDVNAVFWNPAAITGINKAEASFNYNRWFGDLSFTAGAFGFYAGTFGVLAINYIALDYGNIAEALVTSSTGTLDTRTGNSFGGNDLALGLAFAKQFTDKLSIGLNVKYIREDLFDFTSDLFAFDVGTFYHTGWKGIRLAMSAQNFAGDARWLHTKEEEQQSYEIPLMFRIGWSMDLIGGQDLLLGGNPEAHRFSFNMDAIHTNDYEERLDFGGEYILANLLALRGGYRVNREEGSASFGVGLMPRISGLEMRIDYAYVSYDVLDSPHRFTLILSF